MKSLIIAFCGLLLCPVTSFTQEKLPPFPKPGSLLPHSFSALSLNRLNIDKLYSTPEDKEYAPNLRGRRRCLITDIGLKPLVLVFARRTVDANALASLTAGLEKKTEKHKSAYLNAALVVVDNGARRFSDDAPQAVPMPMSDKEFVEIANALVKEEENRHALRKWLTDTLPDYWTDKVVTIGKEKKTVKVGKPGKNVYIAVYPEPDPEKKDLRFLVDAKAEMTIVLAYKHYVMGYQQYPQGAFNANSVQQTLSNVEQMMLKLK